MLTFLRKTRRTLIESGSIRKYMLYAIGEILLVMTGILLALQVNNWNEKSKASIQEMKYLNRIYYDLKLDSVYFSNQLADSQKETNQYSDLIHKIYQKQESIDDFREILDIALFSSNQLNTQNSTYVEMINAGKLDLIRNETLKIKIIKLYHYYQEITSHVLEINEFTARELNELDTKLMIAKYNRDLLPMLDQPNMFQSYEWEWINDPTSWKFDLFEQTIITYSLKNMILSDYFNEILVEIKELIMLLENEIEGRN